MHFAIHFHYFLINFNYDINQEILIENNLKVLTSQFYIVSIFFEILSKIKYTNILVFYMFKIDLKLNLILFYLLY
jgi:hypothetical protein